MNLDQGWFTEFNVASGLAFSLKTESKLHDEQTDYQRIEIYQTTEFGRLMVIDGFIMLTSRDNFIYHEMMSHPALFTHPDPKKILIIGGGDCGTLQEVLKHPNVESALQVEIDEQVTRLAEIHFPELCQANNDPRAEFYFGDGIQWVKDVEAGTYDVIIVDSTDPIGPAEGLFTEAFYRDCHRALGEQGILVQQSESPLIHMSLIRTMREAMGAAGYVQTNTLFFPQCVYPSGWWSAIMAVKASDRGTGFKVRAAKSGFPTRYYTAAMHQGALVEPPFFREFMGRSEEA